MTAAKKPTKNALRFEDRVVIVTGAGGGLGRSHALSFASRGARVVVNDLGGDRNGEGRSNRADLVVAEIQEAGGQAVANYDSVTDGCKIVQTAMDTWGRVDVVVNNAGILRDKSFHKMTDADWDLIYKVHVEGSYKVTHAAWPHMREAGFGRVIFTASAAGIYGNFGQANYSMAKLGLAGFSNTLALEGAKRNIVVNAIAPIAGSRMTETLLPPEMVQALQPEYVSPLVLWLCHENNLDTGGLYEVGGGFFSALRWQRTQGTTFRLGSDVTPEAVANHWDEIRAFDDDTRPVTYPATLAESMAPILDNIQAGPSKGGNDLVDVDQALGYAYPETQSSYDEKDLALYALSVGAASDPTSEQSLQYVYELGANFAPLPTFGVIPAINAVVQRYARSENAPGLNFGVERVLHGEQSTQVIRPLPTRASLTHKSRITDIFDKGKNALIVTKTESFDDAGELLIVNIFTALIRGAGGWGGDRGPTDDPNAPPNRAPDQEVEEAIPLNQALLYRLTGDINPLHADPSLAQAMGYERPILHGLCTYGYAARHVIATYFDGDPSRFAKISARFSGHVFPGETLVTQMWKEEGRILLQCKVKERDAVVLSRASVLAFEA